MSHFTHKLVRTLGQLDSTPQTGGVSYFWGTPPYRQSPQWLLLYTTPRVGSKDRSFRVIYKSLLRTDRPYLAGDSYYTRIPAAYVFLAH
jgi:hypothetical protein